MRSWALGLNRIWFCEIWSYPIFWSSRMLKPMPASERTSQGTHQLALRRMSRKVREGEKYTFAKRSNSESPGCGSDGRAAGDGDALLTVPPCRSTATALWGAEDPRVAA